MSRQTENFFKGFSEFTNDLEIESEDDLKAAMKSFIMQYNDKIDQEQGSGKPETADDYLELAEEAESRKEALKYAKKALKLEPDNIDAQTAVAMNSAANIENIISKLKDIYTSATEQMKEQGFFDDENIGEFWLITETRPYMRLLETYSNTLYECGKMRRAAEILREMIRLCESDNLGARYTLMHIYAYLEDEESALELIKKYKSDDSVQMLLPLSILYYRIDDLKKSASYLRKIRSAYDDIADFLSGLVNGNLDDYIDEEKMSPYGYRPYTMDELLIEFEQHKMMYLSIPAYFEWANRKINGQKK